jgi:transposase-like protein
MFNCDICNAPMVLEKKFSNHKTATMNYRRRRFKCTVCDFKKTIFADGEMDEKFIPDIGIEIIKRKFKQEQINREI